MSSTKTLGKLRHTHVLGIETKPGDSHTSAASLEDVVQLQRRAELAEKRLCEAAEENVRFITPTLINICTFLGALT